MARIITLKLRGVVPSEATISRFLRIPGVVKIVRLFPQETDPELATLYIVSVEPSRIDSVLKQLSVDPATEFAEIPPPRTVI